MTVVYLAVLWTLLYERPQRIVIFGWGLVLGAFLTYFINPTEFMTAGPWKFGLAFPVTLSVFLVASLKECPGLWPVMLSALIGVTNLVMGARSAGGTCLAAAMYLVGIRMMRGRVSGKAKLRKGTIVLRAASIVLGIAGVIWAYGFAASSGILGESAKSK